MDRRDFGKQTLQSLLTFSLQETILSDDAFAADVIASQIKPIAAKWLAEVS